MASPIPIASLYTLFDSASSAALQAQMYLDSRSAEGPYAWYAIPKVAVRATFGLSRQQGGLINVILGRKGTQQFTHELHFSVIATPKPDLKNLPDQPAPSDILVSKPPFLVTPSERPALASIILDALQGRRPYNDSYPDDPGSSNLSKETKTFQKTLTSSKDESVVFLRVSTTPARYLIVRIGDGGIHHGHDGIYLVQPDAQVPVVIYDFLGSKQNAIWYEPFTLLAAAFRNWLTSELPGIPMDAAEVPSFEDIPFSQIGGGLWSSYANAQGATAPAPGVPDAPPNVYSLRDVGASLTYAVPPRDGQQDSPFIQSRLALQVDAKDGQPKLRGQLVAPEFVLIEDARQRFLDALHDRIGTKGPCNNVLNADSAYADDYCTALLDAQRQKQALVFLSYVDQPAKNQFLVVWTGQITGDELQEQRDFAFTCSLGSSGLENFQLVMKLEDPVPGSITGQQNSFDDARISRSGYTGFHNFIHAVRIWDMRVGWLNPPAVGT